MAPDDWKMTVSVGVSSRGDDQRCSAKGGGGPVVRVAPAQIEMTDGWFLTDSRSVRNLSSITEAQQAGSAAGPHQVLSCSTTDRFVPLSVVASVISGGVGRELKSNNHAEHRVSNPTKLGILLSDAFQRKPQRTFYH